LANNTNRNLLATAGSALVCIACIVWIDAPLALWVNSVQNNETRAVGAFLEELGKSHWVLSYAALVAIVAWWKWRAHSINHIALFASVAASGIAANLIKPLVCRSRPPLLILNHIYTFDWLAFRIDFLWNSFPSGHATTGIAIAIAGSAAFPRLKPLMWMIGLSICLGRIIYNVHYLSDVIAGVVLGAVITSAVLRFLPKRLRSTEKNSAGYQSH